MRVIGRAGKRPETGKSDKDRSVEWALYSMNMLVDWEGQHAAITRKSLKNKDPSFLKKHFK